MRISDWSSDVCSSDLWLYSLRDLLMSYGCKIINSAGSTMIDENYTNLALRQKITVQLEIGDYTDPYNVDEPLTIDFALCMVAYGCDALSGQYTYSKPSDSSGRSVERSVVKEWD